MLEVVTVWLMDAMTAIVVAADDRNGIDDGNGADESGGGDGRGGGGGVIVLDDQ